MSENRTITVLGETMEILVSSRSVGASFCAAIQTSPPGGGPPPHMHGREDEMFHVLEGEYEMFDGTSWSPLRQGESRFGPRGQVHAFRNSGTTTGSMLFVATPGGLDDYFAEIAPLEMPRDRERLEEISRRFGIGFTAP